MMPGDTLIQRLNTRKLFRMNATKLGCVSVLLTAMTPVCADQFDTLNFIGSVTVDYDDNIYRLPSGSDPQNLIGKSTKSDLIKIATLGINLDKKYSNQEVTLNATESLNKYTNFTDQDYTSSSIKGAWIFQLTPRFGGAINLNRSQTLNNPADTKVFTRNLNTTDGISINGDYWIHSNWHMVFATSLGKAVNSTNTINNQSSQSRTNEFGVKYDPSNGKTLSLISRNLRGSTSNQVPDPVNLIDNGSSEKQLDLIFSWDINGKSKINGDLMNVDHQDTHFSERNYSGIQGGINYFLGITDKTSLNVSFQRGLSSWWDPYNSYFISDSVSISPTWQMSAKSSLHMVINHGTNDYHGSVFSGGSSRYDKTQSIQIGVDWTPQRSVTFSASLQHNKRTSTPVVYSGYGFIENSALVSAQAYF